MSTLVSLEQFYAPRQEQFPDEKTYRAIQEFSERVRDIQLGLAEAVNTHTHVAADVAEISNLTAAEGAQIENIDTVTITNTQWGYLGALDQGLATTDTVEFDKVGVDNSSPTDLWAQANDLVIGDATGNRGLSIVADAAGNSRIVFAGTTSGNPGFDSGGMIHYTHSSDDLQFYTDSTVAMTIDSSQQVGIGTVSPSELLTLNAGGIQVEQSLGSTVDHLSLANEAGTQYAGIGLLISSANLYIGTDNDPQLMVFDRSTGRIGIGTSSPEELLSIYSDSPAGPTTGQLGIGRNTIEKLEIAVGDADVDITFRQDEPTGAHRFIFNIDSPTSGDQDYKFQNNGTDLLTIDKSGNVGIGTTNPGVALDVEGTIRVGDDNSTDVPLVVGESGQSVQARFGSLQSSGDDSIIRMQSRTTGASNRFADIKLDPDAFVLTLMAPNASGPSNDALNIDSSGNVGIGTTGPDGSLHVHTASAGAVTAAASTDDLVVENSATAGISILTPNTSYGNLYFGDPEDNNSGRIQYNHADDSMQFRTNAVEAMRIDSSGNVGIGTSSPDGSLHVHTASAGAATASSSGDDLVVENSGNAGISVLSSNTSIGSLFFGDPEGVVEGQVRYDHSDDSMSFSVSGSEAMRITSDGGIITPNATGGSQGADTINASGLFVDGVSSARIATGTYTGDGTTSQGITGLGFQPVYVKIWERATADTTATHIFETTDTIMDDNAAGGAIIHNASAADHSFRANRIISLDADGFTVDDKGSSATPNTSGAVYNYMAIG